MRGLKSSRIRQYKARCLINEGASFSKRKQLKKAEELYRSALILNPRSVVAHSNLGLCLAKQGRREDAIVQFRIAHEINPSFPKSRDFIEHPEKLQALATKAKQEL